MAIKKGQTENLKAPISTSTGSQQASTVDSATARKPTTTRLKVRCNCGFNNNLFIRGKGANLSWDKGSPLKNVRADEWIWETTVPFTQCEYKILINDKTYEQGENHHLRCGDAQEHSPRF